MFACARRGSVIHLSCVTYALSRLPSVYIHLSYWPAHVTALRPLLVMMFACFQSREEWQKVFVVAGVIHFIGIIFYGLFASGEFWQCAVVMYDHNFILKHWIEVKRMWCTVIQCDFSRQVNWSHSDGHKFRLLWRTLDPEGIFFWLIFGFYVLCSLHFLPPQKKHL